MKKYMFVIPTLSNGGAERVISVISSALVMENREVIVAKYYTEEDEYSVNDKVKIVNLSGGNRDDYIKLGKFGLIRKLRRTIRYEKPNYIIPFMISVAILTELAAFGMNTEIFQSIRIDLVNGNLSKVQKILQEVLVYRSRVSFVQNEQQRGYFKRKYQGKIHVLYNPVDKSFFSKNHKIDNNKYKVCAMGRLEKQKNFELLIEAFSEAFSCNKNVSLFIYGEGSEREQLNNYIKFMGMQEQIFLMGRTNDPYKVYSESDCFVLSSNYEGMPNALIEAMACSVPCISTNCPTGPSDLISDGENGLLVPIKDKRAMKEALIRIYNMDEMERYRMGINANHTIKQKCLPEHIAQRMIAICECGKQ